MRRRYRRYRHQHDWEVVDKTLIEGMSLEDAIGAAKAANGQVEFTKIVDAAKDRNDRPLPLHVRRREDRTSVTV